MADRAQPPHAFRLAAYGLIAALSIHFILPLIPLAPHLIRWIEVGLGWVAVSSLLSVLYADYRRGGQLLSQTREEMILIGVFGLFWLSFAAFIRAWHKQHIHMASSAPAGGGNAGLQAAGPIRQHGMQGPPRTRVTYIIEEVYDDFDEW